MPWGVLAVLAAAALDQTLNRKKKSGGSAAVEEEEEVIPTPDNFETWRSANAPDASFNDQFTGYINYINEDQFGLTAEQRGSYVPDHVISNYTNRIHADEAGMRDDDRAFYLEQSIPAQIGLAQTDENKRQAFNFWLSNQPDDVKDAGYETQYNKYRSQINSSLEQRPDWMDESDSGYRDFSYFDPGFFKADESYGVEFSGKAYFDQGEADTAFRDYYGTQISDLGYGNLITDNLSNQGYMDALSEAQARDGFNTQIRELGYGSLLDQGMDSSQLGALFGEVQERDRYKTLLDDLGYSYDENDNSVGLGYMYNQALAIEDTKDKLDAAEDAYSVLKGTYDSTVDDMGVLQGEFDTLFGDYGSLTTDYGTLQGTYDTLSTNYGLLETDKEAAEESLKEKSGEYDVLKGLFDTLTTNYGTMTTDYNEAVGDLGSLQTNYDLLDKEKTALKSTYDELFGDYGSLSTDFSDLTKDYEDLAAAQTKTLADLGSEQAAAQGLRRDKRMSQAVDFLTETAADKQARIDSGLASLQAPTLSEYTQAQTALGQTALDPNSYALQPFQFQSSFSPEVFSPTPMTGIMGPDAYGTTDYANLFTGPQMGLTPTNLNVGQSFNPYFDALNQEYGVDLGLPPLGGQNR